MAEERERDAQLIRVDDLTRELAQAADPASLKQLGDKLSVIHQMAEKMRVALEQQNEIARLRIATERKLGELLAGLSHRGGKSPDATRGGASAPLPAGIPRNLSSRAQRLARLPEETVHAYIEDVARKQRSMSIAGLLNWAKRQPAAGKPRPKKRHAPATPPMRLGGALRSAIARMKLASTVGHSCPDPIGNKKLGLELLERPWSGSVLVQGCQNPESWAAKLREEMDAGHIEEAIGVFPIDGLVRVLTHVGQAWCCLIDEDPATRVALYVGPRSRGFCLIFTELGHLLAPVDQ